MDLKGLVGSLPGTRAQPRSRPLKAPRLHVRDSLPSLNPVFRFAIQRTPLLSPGSGRGACVPGSHGAVPITETGLADYHPQDTTQMKHPPHLSEGLFTCPGVLALGAGFWCGTHEQLQRCVHGAQAGGCHFTLTLCLAIAHQHLPEGSSSSPLGP